jgi:hypothetical protein
MLCLHRGINDAGYSSNLFGVILQYQSLLHLSTIFIICSGISRNPTRQACFMVGDPRWFYIVDLVLR